GLRTDNTVRPNIANQGDKNIGVDAKYGITNSLTADFTYNTDFAQVEDDQQQVNLTRFNLLYPEKREFFLESSGVYAFGGVGASVGAGGVGPDSDPDDTPIVFFSRRIGLNANRQIPIEVGGRASGKIGDYGIGALTIRADEDAVTRTPATTFTAIRVKRD